MGWIKNLINAAGKALRREPTPTDNRYFAATITTGERYERGHTSYNPRDWERVVRASSGSISNAVRLIANACARGELHLVRENEDGESEEILSHPALDLLAAPDPLTTTHDLLWSIYAYREAAGSVTIWCGGPKPVGLYVLAPQYTRPIYDSKGVLEGYRYARETTNILTIPANETVTLRLQPDLWNPTLAGTWVDSVRHYADMEDAAVISEINRWKNSGQYGAVFSVPPEYTEEQMEQAAAAMASKGGPFAAGKALILRAVKLEQANAKPHEMNYLPGLQQCEAAIYRAAGIPDSVWKMNDAIQSNAEQGDVQWLRTIYAKQCAVAADLSTWLLPMFGEDPQTVYFAYENPVTEDNESSVLLIERAFAAGAVSVNEYREVLDMDPIEGGDEVRATNAKDPQGTQGQATDNQDGTSAGDGGGDDGASASPAGGGNDANATGESNARKACAEGCSHALELTRWGDFKSFIKKSGPADDITARIERACREWIAATMGEAVSMSGFNPAALQPDKLVELLSTSIQAAFDRGAEQFRIDEGFADADAIPHGDAMQFVKDYTADLVVDITETTANQIKEAITAGIEGGKTMTQIQQEIIDKAPDIAATRSEVIARTETARAYQAGSLKQAEELGFSGKTWDLSGNPCGLCEGAKAALTEPTPIGEPFFRAGDVIVGTDGKTYTVKYDVKQCADLHPNCGCQPIAVSEGD